MGDQRQASAWIKLRGQELGSSGVKSKRWLADRWKQNPLAFIGCIIVGGALFCFIFKTGYRLYAALEAEKALETGKAPEIKNAQDVYYLVLAMAAQIGALFVLWRALIARHANVIAQENIHTTLLTKAVEQLGAMRDIKGSHEGKGADGVAANKDFVKTVANTEVRLGAIYALEKLARDYEPLHWPIMEIFCAYIRENGKAAPPRTAEIAALYKKTLSTRRREERAILLKYEKDSKPPVDVQAALTVIGRRPAARRLMEDEGRARYADGQDYRLDLTGALLEGVNLVGLHFQHAKMLGANLNNATLHEAHLEGANLMNAHLEDANLLNAHLEGADLYDAHLEGANLCDAHLEGANLRGAHLERAILWDAHLEGADLRGAHLERTNLKNAHLTDALLDSTDLAMAKKVSAEMLISAWGNAYTILPEGLERPVNDRWISNESSETQDKRFEHWLVQRDYWLEEARKNAAAEAGESSKSG